LNKTHELPSSGMATRRLAHEKCLQKQPSQQAFASKVPCDIVAFAEAEKSAMLGRKCHDI
jgi:hypothetical protein